MTDAPLDASLDKPNASAFTFDPDDPLAGIRKVEHVDEDKTVGEVAEAVRAMAAAGVLDAVTEEVVRDYVTRRKLLSKSAFRAIVRKSRPSQRALPSHPVSSGPNCRHKRLEQPTPRKPSVRGAGPGRSPGTATQDRSPLAACTPVGQSARRTATGTGPGRRRETAGS